MTDVPKKLPIEKLSPRGLMSLEACTRCGECQNWCPVFNLTENKDVTPRAKIKNLKTIIKSQKSGLFGLLKPKADSAVMEQFAKGLYDCSCCNQCHFVCPSRINTVELWEDVREAMYVAELGPVPEQRTYCENLIQYGNPYKKPQEEKLDWVEKGLNEGTLLERPVLITTNHAPVLLFFGCTASFDEKINKVAQDAVNILTKAGVNFGILGTEENCCYGKLRRMGNPDFVKLAQKNIDQINNLGINTLVTACAGCFKTLKSDYAKVGKMNFKIYHLAEYLDTLIGKGKIKLEKPIPGKVTYHDPCLLGRHNGIYDPPRRVIQAIPGLELVEMDRTRQYSRCCGVGGGLKMANHELQEAASAYRIKDAEATGAEYLTTPCPTCYSGLIGGVAKTASNLKVRHLADLVSESMGLKKPVEGA